MRLLVLFGLIPLLAGAQGGCSGSPKEGAHFENVAGKAVPSGDGSKTGESSGDKKSAPESKSEPKTPKPVMDDAHAGVAKRKRPEQNLPAGVLTAGSFDDNVYPQFFRSFVGKAGQNQHVSGIANRLLGRRVEIVVTNAEGLPVGNARVHVESKADQMSVDLLTRSDGRAIFLSSFDQFGDQNELTVTATSDDGQTATRTVEMDLDRCTVVLGSAASAPPRRLDLTIVLDTTSSMKDEHDFLKSEIKDIASAVRKAFPDVDMRFALVCYRDEGDAYVTKTFGFTADVDEFRTNVAAQSAAGGGDIPEAMHKGLEEAVKLQWRDGNTARVTFLIADAPTHARDANAALAHINALRKKGVVVFPVFASSNDREASEAAEVIMRSASLVTGGQYLFITNDSGVGDSHAEPHIPYYHVEKLNQLMIRMITGELSGKRTDPDLQTVIRTVGSPPVRGRQ